MGVENNEFREFVRLEEPSLKKLQDMMSKFL